MTSTTGTRIARADLEAIDDFYAETVPDHADRVGRAAIAAGRFPSEHPGAGPVVADGHRKWRVPRTDYVLLYRIIVGGVEILRVHHGGENWR